MKKVLWGRAFNHEFLLSSSGQSLAKLKTCQVFYFTTSLKSMPIWTRIPLPLALNPFIFLGATVFISQRMAFSAASGKPLTLFSLIWIMQIILTGGGGSLFKKETNASVFLPKAHLCQLEQALNLRHGWNDWAHNISATGILCLAPCLERLACIYHKYFVPKHDMLFMLDQLK